MFFIFVSHIVVWLVFMQSKTHVGRRTLKSECMCFWLSAVWIVLLLVGKCCSKKWCASWQFAGTVYERDIRMFHFLVLHQLSYQKQFRSGRFTISVSAGVSLLTAGWSSDGEQTVACQHRFVQPGPDVPRGGDGNDAVCHHLAFPMHVCLSWLRGYQGSTVCLDSVHASSFPRRPRARSLRDWWVTGRTDTNNDKNSHNMSINNIIKDKKLRRNNLKTIAEIQRHQDRRAVE